VKAGWVAEQGIREHQRNSGEDTTAFFVLSFPLKPLVDAVVNSSPVQNQGNLRITNPNVSEIMVNYDLVYDGDADFVIFDQLGKEMLHKRTEYMQHGSQKIVLQLNAFPRGEYYLRMLTGSTVVTKPFLVIR
ncbi:MAG: T9SS type A sorting domain-containing protein, partial [Candidatus Kapaibacterium sp.]